VAMPENPCAPTVSRVMAAGLYQEEDRLPPSQVSEVLGLLLAVGLGLGYQAAQLSTIAEVLEANWYDTCDSLADVSDAVARELEIPCQLLRALQAEQLRRSAAASMPAPEITKVATAVDLATTAASGLLVAEQSTERTTAGGTSATPAEGRGGSWAEFRCRDNDLGINPSAESDAAGDAKAETPQMSTPPRKCLRDPAHGDASSPMAYPPSSTSEDSSPPCKELADVLASATAGGVLTPPPKFRGCPLSTSGAAVLSPPTVKLWENPPNASLGDSLSPTSARLWEYPPSARLSAPTAAPWIQTTPREGMCKVPPSALAVDGATSAALVASPTSSLFDRGMSGDTGAVASSMHPGANGGTAEQVRDAPAGTHGDVGASSSVNDVGMDSTSASTSTNSASRHERAAMLRPVAVPASPEVGPRAIARAPPAAHRAGQACHLLTPAARWPAATARPRQLQHTTRLQARMPTSPCAESPRRMRAEVPLRRRAAPLPEAAATARPSPRQTERPTSRAVSPRGKATPASPSGRRPAEFNILEHGPQDSRPSSPMIRNAGSTALLSSSLDGHGGDRVVEHAAWDSRPSSPRYRSPLCQADLRSPRGTCGGSARLPLERVHEVRPASPRLQGLRTRAPAGGARVPTGKSHGQLSTTASSHASPRHWQSDCQTPPGNHGASPARPHQIGCPVSRATAC